MCDYMIIYGFEDGNDQDKSLRQQMLRPRDGNCKFNPEKFVVKTSEIPFYSHIISKSRIKPDPKKVEEIVQM